MQIKLQIKNRWTGSIIFEFETEKNTMAKTVTEYIKQEKSSLSDADLSDADLSGANLSRADLSDASLSDANLSDADLSDANLSGADLSDADLSRADLSDADLSDANLSGADLSDADLSRADLSRADLDTIKYDFFGRMLMQKNEIPALREKLINGEINGSQYEGKCACFVGTIANVKHVGYENLDLRPNSKSPTEKWFMGISEGMKPDIHNICKITLDWIDEFLKLLSV